MPLLPARLAALPRRGKPCWLRPYHRPRDYHNLFRSLPSPFSSSASASPFSSSSSSSSPSSSLFNSHRLPVAACGVRARRCRAPLFFRTHPPPPLQGFINRSFSSTTSAMAATKIDGTAIAKNIRAGLKTEIEQIQQANPRFKPSLVIFQGTFSAWYQYRSDRKSRY